MIKEFVERFEKNKDALLKKFQEKHPENYLEIVKAVIEAIATEEYGDLSPDPERIHEIDDGNYQGTLLYIIAEKGYQPSTYYSVFVGYGSCSGCDTLKSIRSYRDELPTKEQQKDYMGLALNIVQGLKKMSKEEQS